MAIVAGEYLGILTNGVFDSNHTSANPLDVFLWGWWEGSTGNITDIYLDYPDIFFCNEIIGQSATGNHLDYDDMPVMWCG